MIVFNRNGQRIVLSGWRAWLILVPTIIVAGLILVLVASLAVGIALAVAAVLLVAVPVALVLALIAQKFPRRKPGQDIEIIPPGR